MSDDTSVSTEPTATDTPAGTPAEPAAAAPFAEENAAGVDDPIVAALLTRTAVEYGRFTARTALTVGGQLAFTAGSPVPIHHPGVPGWLAEDLLDDATPGEPIVPEQL